MKNHFKALVPIRIRSILRRAYDSLWTRRHYDNYIFGCVWSLLNSSYKIRDFRFELPLELMPIGFRARFLFDKYEFGERALCQKHLHPEDSILELGACIGVVSTICNHLLKDQSKHVVVEANPTLIPWIEKNRARNFSKFSIEHGMLSKSSNGDFRIERFIVSGSAHTTTGELVKVPVMSVEDVCKKHNFIPSTLIMDIEGGEIDFVAENREWLRLNSTVRKIIVEVHPGIVGERAIGDFYREIEQLDFKKVESIGTVEYWHRE